MCSTLTQLAFAVIMLGAIALTIGSTFSNKWSTIAVDLNDSYNKLQHQDYTHLRGIVPWVCEEDKKGCAAFWKDMKQHEKVVASCMIIALILEIIAFIWNFVTSCACCCKKHLLHPLSPLSFTIVFFLSVAIAVYYIDNSEEDPALKELLSENLKYNVKNIEIGSAFWMAVGAWILAVIDTILASFALFFAQHGI